MLYKIKGPVLYYQVWGQLFSGVVMKYFWPLSGVGSFLFSYKLFFWGGGGQDFCKKRGVIFFLDTLWSRPYLPKF